ncbi:putative phospholipid-transporting ATPase IF-like protein [Dinothrombium tinctorium]|uniref:Phospholipid-transporting ATPase n=1 Tax=Dinothrombium tinctorium TaxID=1965070 RepID=A0A3S3P9F3_9ACAR|nr:putative phospholipid-transporting ATPase IF-like protein [Dinothrombium tinctorium]
MINSAHVRSQSPPKTRTALLCNKQVIIDGKAVQESRELPLNRVVTAKIANFYFLCIAILQVTTNSPVSPVTSLVPLIFVVTTTALKQAYEDWLRHKSDHIVNKRSVPVLIQNKLVKIRSEEIKVGDIVLVSDNEEIPCDIVMLSSAHNDGKCHVTTANLDGEINLKVRECLPCTNIYQKPEDFATLNGFIECEQPNTDLYEFVGVLTICTSNDQVLTYPLGANNILLRGSRLKNTGHVYGVAVYTGRETKMALNSRLTSNKFSSIEKTVNKSLILYFCILVLLSTCCTSLRVYYRDDPEMSLPWYLLPLSTPKLTMSKVFEVFLNFFVLFNYIIPISLYVSLEMVKFFGSKTLVSDPELFCYETQQKPICNSSDLNEELGQVEYLFSDKTGTLTENMMRFTACTVNGILYQEKNNKLWFSNAEMEPTKEAPITPELEEFFIALCICNSCQVVFEKGIYTYQGDSPDEKALVEAANNYGVTLSIASNKECEILLGSSKQKRFFEKLHVFEFDSSRKRMSVIVKDEKGCIFLVCKGAETVLCDLIVEGKLKETLETVDKYAHHGLRTLVIGRKNFSEEEYAGARKEIQESSISFENRKQRLAATYAKIEANLTVLGATAVEDRLQDGVPETIADLKLAGIKVWVLTGDKLETAVSVAYSCHLLDEKMEQLLLSRQQNSEACGNLINQFRAKILDTRLQNKQISYALIIDGRSLYMAMKFYRDQFQSICENSAVVLCCRMSPIQKAEVVHMIKMSNKRPVTAAIGDGANDVSMIQEAHVGFGLMGKEGRQAVNSSDFAFSKFKHIRRALLVHGHLFYTRVSAMIHYFFYKNVIFVTPQVVYSFYNAFSGQTLFHGMLLMAYNVLFTAAPIVVYGITEKYIPSEILDKFPELYKLIRHNRQMRFWEFMKRFLVGVFHGAIVFYCLKDIWGNGTTLFSSGQFGSLYSFGTMIYQCIIIIVNLELVVMTRDWNIYFTSSVVTSLICVPIFLVVYTNFKWGFINDDLFGIYMPLLKSFAFWCSLMLVSTIALVPDVLYVVITNSINFNEFPSLIDRKRVARS